MQGLGLTRRERIDGNALFSAVAFALCLGLIAALERVGAPDGFVEALGPFIAFVALSVVGLANRAQNLTDFLAVRRAGPTLYGGFAFVAIVAGLALAREAEGGETMDVVFWAPMAIGAALASLVLAPAVRHANVSAAVDVLATRFPSPPTRAVFALVFVAVGLLTEMAGFSLATQSAATALEGNARAGAYLVVVALAFTLPPGGARSAFWTDAASGGLATLIVLIGAALAALDLNAPYEPLAGGLVKLSQGVAAAGRDPAGAAALMAAITFFIPLTLPAIAAGSAGAARRMAILGLAFGLLGLAAAAMALPVIAAAAPGGGAHTANALVSAAAFLPTLALARAGAFVAARSTGLDLTRAHSRLTVLSSQRVALSRLAMIAAIAVCPLALRYSGVKPGDAITAALAVTLAFVAPSLTLGLSLRRRGSSPVAAAALITATATLAARWTLYAIPPLGEAMLTEALLAGLVGLVVGALVALVFPARDSVRWLPQSDPFAETPLDRQP